MRFPSTGDLSDLLEEQHPEGAIVATPNGTHSAVAEVCAGKSVDLLIEKPIADTLPAARRIVEVARCRPGAGSWWATTGVTIH